MFGVRFAFFGKTDAAVRLRILEGRRRRLEERREKVRAALTRTRERWDSYTLELQRHGLESVEREVRWLNELIETERAQAPGFAPVPHPPAPAGTQPAAGSQATREAMAWVRGTQTPAGSQPSVDGQPAATSAPIPDDSAPPAPDDVDGEVRPPQ
jgi:hypothetical protein